jgi:hypothetical protein
MRLTRHLLPYRSTFYGAPYVRSLENPFPSELQQFTLLAPSRAICIFQTRAE